MCPALCHPYFDNRLAAALAGLTLAIFLAIVVVCLVFYRITKSLNVQIAGDLAQRRTEYAGIAAGVAGTTTPGGPRVAIIE